MKDDNSGFEILIVTTLVFSLVAVGCLITVGILAFITFLTAP